MDVVELIGLLAATFTTAAFVPQVIQLWRTRNADGISLPTFVIFSVGVLMWLAYGLLRRATPIIAANLVTIVLSAVVIFQVVRIRARAAKEESEPS